MMKADYKYDSAFYDYIERGSIRSSEVLVPLVLSLLDVKSVLDVGCGRGAWLRTWSEYCVDVTGVDGEYVDSDDLLIEKGRFVPHDLRQPFNLGKRFSLVQCLEVAEHLPEGYAEQLVASLCRHGDVVLFSAAVPGQGGENHINEQPYAYWRCKFTQQGFRMFDPFRSKLSRSRGVENWYKYNVFLYVREASCGWITTDLESYLVPDDRMPLDLSPFIYKMRRRVVRLLPRFLATLLAQVKKRFFIMRFKLEGFRRGRSD
jgi:SAM-dependent methyltransferase